MEDKFKVSEEELNDRMAMLFSKLKTDSLFGARFVLKQRDQINSGLIDSRVSVDILLFYANKKIPAETMSQIRIAATRKLSIDNIKFILRFRGKDGPMDQSTMSTIRDLLGNSKYHSDVDFIGKILIEDNKPAGSKYLDVSPYGGMSKIAETHHILKIVSKFIKNGHKDKLYEYVDNHSFKENRQFLALCNKFHDDEFEYAIECLNSNAPLNVIYCYLFVRDGNKTWDDISSFLDSHKSAANYILVFCSGKLDKKAYGDVIRLFNMQSNRLIDELYFEHNVNLNILQFFTKYTETDARHTVKSRYSGYAIISKTESSKLCNTIVELLAEGWDGNYISKFIDSNCNNPKLALDIARKHRTSADAAIETANELGVGCVMTDNGKLNCQEVNR